MFRIHKDSKTKTQNSSKTQKLILKMGKTMKHFCKKTYKWTINKYTKQYKAQWCKHLPGKCKVLSLVPSTKKRKKP